MRLKIRKLRREREMTQRELATYLDVKQSTICGWEKAAIIPPLDKCLKIASVFGVSIYDLIEEEEPGGEETVTTLPGVAQSH